MLDAAANREVAKGQRYIGGEPVDEEDDGGRCSGTPMDAEDVLVSAGIALLHKYFNFICQIPLLSAL